MRKDEIRKLMHMLQRTWLAEPHLRFGQLVENIAGPDHTDCIFYLGDEQWLRKLEAYNDHTDRPN